MPTRRRALIVLLLLAALALASLGLGLAAGNLPVSVRDLYAALAGHAGGMEVEVIRQLRLPRVLAAFACGGLLALAGAVPLLGACHATAGAGEDITATGHALTNSAEKNTP